jgi:citrate lyase alpha subunit
MINPLNPLNMNINHIEITQIKGIIAKASIEELRMLNETIINTIKYKRNLESSVKKVGLSVGMTVRVNHPKLAGKELSVNKINRTKATVSVKSGACYIVPISLIEY